jgi:RNA polymerase sigma factor (sigma-70 family)
VIALLHHHPHYIKAVEAERHELDAMVKGAKRGDAASWNALVARFTARVRANARRHRLAPHDVDDVTQTTWLRLLEHIGSVREPAALGAWLETTAQRESLRVIRKSKRERTTEQQLNEEVVEPVAERELVAAERKQALEASLERLPARQRALIGLMVANPSMSYTDIAETLDAPIGSIGPTRARSFERLRRDPELLRACG